MLFVHEEHGLSVSKACTAAHKSKHVSLQTTPRDGSLVITTLLELAERYPRYGFAKYFVVLRRAGYTWNHKRVYRIYRQLQLNMRRKGNRRLPSRAPVRLEAANRRQRLLVCGLYGRCADARSAFSHVQRA